MYVKLLQHISSIRTDGKVWIALPRQISTWWRQRAQMSLVRRDGNWEIEGEGKERARIAYAVLKDDQLDFEIQPA